MIDDTLTGPPTRYLAFQSYSGAPWKVLKTTAGEGEALFWTRESAQAYCDCRNAGIDARKANERGDHG